MMQAEQGRDLRAKKRENFTRAIKPFQEGKHHGNGHPRKRKETEGGKSSQK